MEQQSQNHYPHVETIQYGITELTKEWTPEERMSFSKFCFDNVAKDRFNKYKKYPQLNIQITHRS